MPWSFPPQSSFLVLAILLALLGFTSFVSSLVAARRKKVFSGILSGVLTLLLWLSSLLFGAVSAGLHGYEALTNEEVIVLVTTVPTGEQQFEAHFQFPDGTEHVYQLAGDQLYVDAHILKWKPFANVFGLHTQFVLDRVGGRYHEIQDERTRPRTIYAMSTRSKLDLFRLRKRWERLSPLYDADYGSATWADAQSESQFELRISTTGLLLRPLIVTGADG
jgi:hypothetical protein